jgi:HEAT repeat protein
VSERTDQFVATAEPVELCDLSRALSSDATADEVSVLIDCLKDPMEARREFAAYALGFRRSREAAPALIELLGNRGEAPSVRGQAGEALSLLRRKKSIRPLINASRDPSPEVRFWSVFALGSFTHRGRKPRRAVVNALEDRLTDDDTIHGYWPIRLEALAMLRSIKPWSIRFDEEIATSTNENWRGFYL